MIISCHNSPERTLKHQEFELPWILSEPFVKFVFLRVQGGRAFVKLPLSYVVRRIYWSRGPLRVRLIIQLDL